MSGADSMVEIYVFENSQLLEQLETMLLDSEKQAELTSGQIDEIFRVMHTIKGSSAMMGYEALMHLAHGMEDMFSVLRQNLSAPKEAWALIFDLVLECIDFFKNEIAKIQEGLLPDGDSATLHARSVALHKMISGAPEQEAPGDIVMPTDAAPAGGVGGGKADDSLRYYRARIFFAADCSMESVRAFAVINSLEGMYEKIAHEPADLSVNCDEAIINNGLTIYMASACDNVEIEARLAETMFLESMELFEYTDSTQIPNVLLEHVSEDTSAKEEPSIVEEAPVVEAAPAAAPAPQAAPAPAAQKDAPARAPSGGATQNFLSVNVGKVDKLLDLVGEIVTTESMVTKHPDITSLKIESFEKQSRRLRQLTDELQDVVMSIRMVPISSTFRKMQRIVRDMCRKTGKEADLVIIGEQTEVDKNVIENLSDPLMHMIRNAMDHGLEPPEDRIALGKPEVGKVTLEARNSGGDVVIIVSDDGRGLNREKLIKKAQEKGLTNKLESEISDREAFGFILAPGFSTKDQVTEFSGRGVGMDVVCSNIEKMGGSVSIDSVLGKGTSFIINIPLTLAIIDGMDVQVGHEHYIIPILNIRESFEPKLYDLIIEPDGSESMLIRNECFRVERLHRLFNVETEITDLKQGIMVLVETDQGSTCLFVDKLVGEQQAVIKPLPTYVTQLVGRIPHISGCTILGNGSISLILDANSLTSTSVAL